MSQNPFNFDDDDERDRKKSKSRRRDDDDRPRSKRRPRDEDEEDDRPRSKVRRERDFDDEDEDDDDDDYRPSKPRRGTCPNCGSTRSSKVSYTWWGGVLGPAMFSLVQCGKCRTQYNKNSGKKIGAGVIVVYSVVIGVIALAAVVAIRIALN